MINRRPMTLMQATTLGADFLDDLTSSDLNLTDDERECAVRVWSWLLNVDNEARDATRARREVLRDAGLIVAPNLPAAEFLAWFRRGDWQCFDSTERTGSDAWAWAALDRTRSACGAIGPMALQQPLSPRFFK